MIIYWPGVYTFNGYFSEEDLQMFWVYRYKGFSFTAARTVHTALVLSVAVGALLTVLGLVTAAPIMRLLGTPDEILPDAALYLRIYFLGMIPQMLYNMGTNILRAIGDSKRPLYFLIAASLVNIVLDVVFIAVFGWARRWRRCSVRWPARC